jgi:hypothetical protein
MLKVCGVPGVVLNGGRVTCSRSWKWVSCAAAEVPAPVQKLEELLIRLITRELRHRNAARGTDKRSAVKLPVIPGDLDLPAGS